ncbi:MAG: PH domain-containing protein [Planctomycetaceae bacterium]|jgi:uncharacterized membrane protein YdbT with pleckstrin-like domain
MVQSTDEQERVLYESHPAMFGNHPVGFVLSVILSLVGVGLVILLIWYIRCVGTTLTVTNEQTTLRRGILSKFTNDVFHENVRNIIVRQTFLQRIFGVGSVGISSAGQSGIEIEVNGIPDPDRVKQIIDDCRK